MNINININILIIMKLFIYILLLQHYFLDSYAMDANHHDDQEVELVAVHHRSKRKILLFDNDNFDQWPTEIPYFFNKGDFNGKERSIIKGVLENDFQTDTCLSFTEEEKPPTERQFIRFRSDPTISCRASVGLVNATAPFTGQDIFLHDNCFAYRGNLIYAIAATLGMHGEILRPDRDEYVDLFPENAFEQYRPLLTEKLSALASETHDIPYDYGSVMHTAAKSYAKGDAANKSSTLFTVLPKDIRYARTIGQRSELSFYDILAINRAYCWDQAMSCLGLNCQNGGHTALDCSKCLCRDGFSGRECEQIDPGSDNCAPSSGIINVPVDNSTQCLQSPNYGWPKTEYNHGDKCSWLLRAPEDRRIDAWFSAIHHFFLPSRGVGYTPCLHWVEILHEGPSAINGPRYCNSNVSRTSWPEPHLLEPPWEHFPITSTGNEMMINFKAPNFQTPHSKSRDHPHVGFKLCYKIAAKEPEPETSGGVLELKSKTAMSSTTIYAIAIAVSLLVVILLVVLVCCVCRRRKTPPSPPPTPAPTTGQAFDNPDYNVYYISGAQGELVDIEKKKDPTTKDENQDNDYCELQRAMLPYDPPPRYEDLKDVSPEENIVDELPPKK